MNSKIPMPQRTLVPSDFNDFYQAIHCWRPFSWQSELAEQVCESGWPDSVDMPTASGKTAVIDIAVFALAYQAGRETDLPIQRRAPRRIFFTVDRRLIVNQAYQHGREIARRLWDAAKDPEAVAPVLCRVAAALQSINGKGVSEVPLDCYELRGGIPRDDAWVRSPTQPTIITTTVDQLGSRMLFRGYGVSDRNLPIHAALTTQDALVLLDEAHCCVPFGQTVRAIQRYRGPEWAEQAIKTPFQFVPMTATPTDAEAATNVFRIKDKHYASSDTLRERHECEKPVRLVLDEKAKGKNPTKHKKIAKTLVDQAISLTDENGSKRIAIVVNRVAIAKEVHRLLLQRKHSVELMIGRMRPIDRDELSTRLNALYRCDPSRTFEEDPIKRFLVATQTIEVGADYDFDAMVSQCASIDALKQRFGRLNRLGKFNNCHGVIVAAAGDIVAEDKLDPDKPLDPIYANSLARTWNRLQKIASEAKSTTIDFGIRSANSVNRLSGENFSDCSAPSDDALVLMPAHVDMLCQTMPKPEPDPNVAMYLHGVPAENQSAGCASVRLCWRSDLRLPNVVHDLDASMNAPKVVSDWTEAINACPPSTGECMTVPRYLVQAWLKGQISEDQSGDVDGERLPSDPQVNDSSYLELARYGLVWRGAGSTTDRSGQVKDRSFIAGPSSAWRVADGDVIILPSAFGGWEYFGHVPDGPDDPSLGWKGFRAFLEDQAEAPKGDEETTLNDWKRIDIADDAYQQSRARTIFRVHDALPYSGFEKRICNDWLAEFKSETASLSAGKLYKELAVQIDNDDRGDDATGDEDHKRSLPERLERLREHGRDGLVKRYPGGFNWISKRHAAASGMPPLPSQSFDDGLESRSGNLEVGLLHHLADVWQQVTDQANQVTFPESITFSLQQAALWHDIGKADPRFQANLRDMPLAQIFMQRGLLAKSGGYGRSKHATLPAGFRHEFLSLALMDHAGLPEQACEDLVGYLIGTHHGFARPFGSPKLPIEAAEIDLTSLGGPVVSEQSSVWRTWMGHLQSEIADRFWKHQRRFGPWGIAYLECLLRLSDWNASAEPSKNCPPIELSWRSEVSQPRLSKQPERTFSGIEAGNPLGFLSAIGLFRVLDVIESSSRFAWQEVAGGWSPSVSGPLAELSEDELLDRIGKVLSVDPDKHPTLADGKSSESVRERFLRAVNGSTSVNRTDADWLSCESSDGATGDVISQLQTSRRDYHAIGIRGLLEETKLDHLKRTLYQNWDYADPIAGVSLHLEPREDRRHAYQWHTPSGDPTRKVHGGMIGANRLALEAWPMFQSLPDGDRLRTTGFRGRYVSDTKLSWPIWSVPVTLDTVRSLLALAEIQRREPSRIMLAAIGIERVYQSSRILVGKTPNLTPATAVAS